MYDKTWQERVSCNTIKQNATHLSVHLHDLLKAALEGRIVVRCKAVRHKTHCEGGLADGISAEDNLQHTNVYMNERGKHDRRMKR